MSALAVSGSGLAALGCQATAAHQPNRPKRQPLAVVARRSAIGEWHHSLNPAKRRYERFCAFPAGRYTTRLTTFKLGTWSISLRFLAFFSCSCSDPVLWLSGFASNKAPDDCVNTLRSKLQCYLCVFDSDSPPPSGIALIQLADRNNQTTNHSPTRVLAFSSSSAVEQGIAQSTLSTSAKIQIALWTHELQKHPVGVDFCVA